MRQSARHLLIACAGFGLLGSAAAQSQQSILPVVDENATMADKLGQDAKLDLTFRDERGEPVVLADLVSGERPIVLNLGYFNCPRACGPILGNLLDGLKNAELTPGVDVDILSVSIDHRETHEVAGPKQQSFIDALGKPGAAAHWRFLTGEEDTIRTLADSVGYRFAYNEQLGEYDHPPTVVMLSPVGKIAQYVDGTNLTPVTLRNAVIEAGEGKVGTFLERILVSCLTYDPDTGEYTVVAMTIMRIGGAITVLVLGLMIFNMWRRERAKPPVAATS